MLLGDSEMTHFTFKAIEYLLNVTVLHILLHKHTMRWTTRTVFPFLCAWTVKYVPLDFLFI